MLHFIKILIVLCTISAVSAGPIRRYTNATIATSTGEVSGVDYAPPTNSPSTSALFVEGKTRLPTSLLAGGPAESPTTLSSASFATLSSNLPSPDTTTSTGRTFQYQPLESDSTTTTAPNNQPTSFGNQHAVTTMTVWSTTWTTVPGRTRGTDSAGSHTSQQTTNVNQPHNATSSPEQTAIWTSQFSFDPLPTSSSNPTHSEPPSIIHSSKAPDPTGTSSQHEASDLQTSQASTFQVANPSDFAHASPTSSVTTASTNLQDTSANSDATDLPRFSLGSSARLPEVVTERAPATQSKQDVSASVSANVPGITIVPHNPSVVYITTTVTDAGVTTTLTT
ncbi:hypothetical protein Q7P37_006274 [Cladosporium fusiforme]